MTVLRPVLLTILLTVLVAELLLPIYSHHWLAARARQTHTFIEIVAVPRGDGEQNQRRALVTVGDGDQQAQRKTMVFVNADPWTDLIVAFGLPIFLLACCIHIDRDHIPGWIIRIATPRHAGAELPPPDVPPQRAVRGFHPLS